MANTVTGARIVLSVALLFFKPFSAAFYALYIAAGLTDIADGAIARKTKSESEFGSRFDTVADFAFLAVCSIKLIPVFDLPAWIYVWIALIALIKAVNVVSGFVVKKKFASAHTVMNRITGALLFALPLTVRFVDVRYSSVALCAAATFAAVQEGHFIRTGRV